MSSGTGLEPRFSNDGLWYWNGSAWIPASQAPRLSADGQWYWNGSAWIKTSQAPVPPPSQIAPAPSPSQQSPPYMPSQGGTTGVQQQWGGHAGRNLLIGLGGLIILAIVISLVANAGAKQPPATPVGAVGTRSADATQSQPTASSSAVATPTKAAEVASPSPKALVLKVLLDKTGSGVSKTAYFNTPSEWQIVYSFDCSSFGYKGNFQIYVYDGSSQLKDIPVNALAMSGSDTIYEHNLSGPYYLEMNSECDWHVTVSAYQ